MKAIDRKRKQFEVKKVHEVMVFGDTIMCRVVAKYGRWFGEMLAVS